MSRKHKRQLPIKQTQYKHHIATQKRRKSRKKRKVYAKVEK